MTTSGRTVAELSPRTGPSSDVRGLWRLALAIVAPIPMLAKGVEYLLNPVDGDASFVETVTAYQAHLPLVEVLRWFDLAFGILLIPATVAVIWTARRGAPRLTTVGAVICLPAFLTAFYLLGGPHPEVLTARYGLDIDSTAALVAAAENDPTLIVAGLLFLVGIVIGLPILAIAAWRSHAVPSWMAFALIVGAGTHPFLPGHLAQGVGLLVGAIGFAGASVALLRTPNDEFDLPARDD